MAISRRVFLISHYTSLRLLARYTKAFSSSSSSDEDDKHKAHKSTKPSKKILADDKRKRDETSSSSSDEENKNKVSKDTLAGKAIQVEENQRKAASKKLADLLSNLKIEGVKKSSPNIPFASVKPSTSEAKAQEIGGDSVSNSKFNLAKPLLKKTKNIPAEEKIQSTSPIDSEKDSSIEDRDSYADIDPPMVEAVKSVSESFVGDREKTKAELLLALRSQSTETEGAKKAFDFKDLVFGMKVDRAHSKPDRVLMDDRRRRTSEGERNWKSSRDRRERERDDIQHGTPLYRGKRNAVFKGKPLGIFDKAKAPEIIPNEDNSLFKSIMNIFEEKELEKMLAVPPSNAYEEMIMWTKQGKLWKFPIDNEQGMVSEDNVPFHEHIFLERHLKDGFPDKGPIRHFMELVCVGLSKNHYITVERKLRHIQWFRDYFKSKEAALLECEVEGSQQKEAASSSA